MKLYRLFKKYVVTCCLTLIIGFSILPLHNVSGDGGMLPLTYTWLYQPSQNAIVAWDGTEEILILSTNIMGGANATAIQILPFPTYPEIKRGNESSFHKISELVSGVVYKHEDIWLGVPTSAGGAGIEVLFTTQIGVHNLTVLRVNDSTEFTLFLKDVLRQKNQSLLEKFDALFPNFENISNNYVEQNIKYFVIDDIEVKSNLRTVEPIIYRFNTSYLYYPMVMTSMIFDFIPEELELDYYGYYYKSIAINIFTITQALPRDEHITEIGFERRALFEIDKNSLRDISPEFGEMFHNNAWLGSYTARVSLTEAKTSRIFSQDFIIRETYAPPAWGWVVAAITICGIVFTAIFAVYTICLIKGVKLRKR